MITRTNSEIESGNHKGEDYKVVLERLHRELKPRTYLEIGTRGGDTLSLATCNCLAIDPDFAISNPSSISRARRSLFYNMTSDDFFLDVDPSVALGGAIDLAFLDGMHRCEYLLRDFKNVERHSKKNSIVAIHDCLPVELPMTCRVEGFAPAIDASKQGWWTGDVWRTALLLKRERPRLEIIALDAYPTGLILITNLDPTSNCIDESYNSFVKKMMSYDLEKITIPKLFEELNIESTNNVASGEALTKRFWL